MQEIAILRLSALGDVTHVLPMLHALQKQHPKGRITWVIGKLEHKLLAGLPGVEFVEFDKKQGFQALKDLRKRLYQTKFDVLLHMQVALRANITSRCIRARRRIGFDRNRSADGHGLFVNERISGFENANEGEHQVDAFFRFATHLNASEEEKTWQIPLQSNDAEWATSHLDADRPSVVISPVSSHQLRNWNPAGYATVIDQLTNRGYQTILIGGPSDFERKFANAILDQCSKSPLDLTGQDTLKQMTALLSQCDLAICPDTGPLHIASAMNTPVIGLHAASNPQRSGAYRFLDLAVDRYNDAAEKFLNRSAKDLKWGTKIEQEGVMDLIQVADVMEKVDLWEQVYFHRN